MAELGDTEVLYADMFESVTPEEYSRNYQAYHEEKERKMAKNKLIVKQLRLGSHVMVDGIRVKVEFISESKIDTDRHRKAYMGYYPEELDPIPITEDLLKELGFSEEKDGVDNVKIYTKHGEEYHLQASLWDGRRYI